MLFYEIDVVEIIDIVGYENPTYFYKIFKEKFKMPPRKYKLELQKH
jgi:YesN/AraC family two-component response regulator